jgi:hypothetical protein
VAEAVRHPWLRLVAQVVAAGGAGALTAVGGAQLAVLTTFTVGVQAGLLVVVVLAGAGIGLLTVVAAIAPETSWLTRTAGGRVGWAVLVGGLGSAGLLLGWNVSEAAGLRPGLGWLPLSIVPFMVAAGLLLRRWYLAVGSLALVVAAAAGMLNALADTVPDLTEANLRVMSAGRDRSEFFVTEIPGYHNVGQQGAVQLEPDDPALIPPDRHITLYTLLDNPTPDCEYNPRDPDLQGWTCTVERPGLTYNETDALHGYFLRTGSTLLEIVGTLTVDRATLRDAILRAVPGTDPAVYTVDIPGYDSTRTSPRPGMSFEVADKTLLPAGRTVDVHVAKLVPTIGTCGTQYLECVNERPDLFYRRLADKHLYVRQQDSVEVQVVGGLGVDRDALRAATLAARPATDDELLAMLRPVPDWPQTFMDSVKVFAKRVFGP